MSGSRVDGDEIHQTSSMRTRTLLGEGFAVAKLSDYTQGNIQKVLGLLATMYSAYIVFNPFDAASGDCENKYYVDRSTGSQYMVATVYYTLTEAARAAEPMWTLLNVNLKDTAFPSCKVSHDYLAGKAKMYWSSMILNPFMSREEKLKETDHVVKQVHDTMDWDENADRNILTGLFNKDSGWQWFIAAEFFTKYAQKLDELFHKKKITDREGNVLKAYGEAEMSEMTNDISKREKRDNKRKMVAYLTFSTCPSSIELDALKDEALKSTEEAQDRVHNYSGSKIFNKPKKSKNTPSASVEVKSKALNGKHGQYWRVSIWIKFQDEAMAKAPTTVSCWQLPTHPTISLNKPGEYDSHKKSQKNFQTKAVAQWSSYSTPQAKKGKSNKKKKDFGPAAAVKPSAAASSSSGQLHKSRSATKKVKPSSSKKNASTFQEDANSAVNVANNLVTRLTQLESQMVATASKKDCEELVTKRFKNFEKIMRQFALQMTQIQDSLTAASVTADEIVTALSQDATAEERQRLTVKFTGSFPGFSADQVKLVVDAHLKEKAMEGIALSKKISTIGASVKESARNLGNVHRQVSNTVDALAKEAGMDSPVPKVLVSGKKSKTSKHAQQPTTAQQQQHVQQGNAKGKGKRQRPPDTQDSTTRKCIALGVQSSASDSGAGSGPSSDSDSDSSSGGMKTPPAGSGN